MKIKQFTFNPFQENTYIIWDNTKECLIIDPGCYEDFEKKSLQAFIQENKLNPVKLINTHCHIDHIFGNKFSMETWNINLHMNNEDLPILLSARESAKNYGFQNFEESPNPNFFLEDGFEIKFGESFLEVLFTPGHSPGHICLYNKLNKFIIAGDVLFKGSIGRTDLTGGNFETIIHSINTKLMCLNDEVVIYSGHGPSTTIGEERKYNPFLKQAN